MPCDARWDVPSGRLLRVTIDPLESVFRLLLVFALAFGIGLERQIRRKPVGFGTFIFVSTGAAALAILAIDLESDNPLTLLGVVITGIGFLGAGALIRANDRVFGFTTAALVWAMAALGVAAGAGLYLLVIVNYTIVWAVVITDRFLEGRGFGSHARIFSNSRNLPSPVTTSRWTWTPWRRYTSRVLRTSAFTGRTCPRISRTVAASGNEASRTRLSFTALVSGRS